MCCNTVQFEDFNAIIAGRHCYGNKVFKIEKLHIAVTISINLGRWVLGTLLLAVRKEVQGS
jgi:hypothetical protein